MTGWIELLTVAFVAQLAVLPGEKVQFIIAGLSTRYHPLLVVGAAGSAFAGWTALEILFGAALKGAFPEIVLDGMTAGLFLLFAVLLVRSAPEGGDISPETDGGVAEGIENVEFELPLVNRRVPHVLGGFVPIFLLMAAGEFGDKTQLVTIGLAVQYGAHPAIWAGEMLAIIPVSLANAYFFHTFSHRFDVRKAHYFGAAIFTFFGLDTVLKITTGISIWEQIVGMVTEIILALIHLM
ncbi:MAG: TMEM165/GDT1 family protein [Halobacteriales archaeon]